MYMSISMPGDNEDQPFEHVQGIEQTADGENKSVKIDLPVATSDTEVFLIESIDIYEANGRIGSTDERTIQAAISTYGDPDAIAGEGPTDFEAGSSPESVLWLQAMYHHFSAANNVAFTQTYDPLKSDATAMYPYGHLFFNLENLDSVNANTSAETGYTIAGQVVDVDTEMLANLLRSVPDPRRF